MPPLDSQVEKEQQYFSGFAELGIDFFSIKFSSTRLYLVLSDIVIPSPLIVSTVLLYIKPKSQ